MPDLVLRVEPYLAEVFTHRVTTDAAVLGRSSKADLVIPDRYISRLQARVFRDGDLWMVEDLGGRNPTRLNGRPISQPERLAPGDVITVSETRLVVERDAPPPPGDAVTEDLSGNTLFRSASALIAAADAKAMREDLGEAGLRHHTSRLRVLNEFHRSLAAAPSLNDVLGLLLDRAFADLRPEEGLILLKDAQGQYAHAASRRLPGTGGDFLYSRSLVREVTEKGLAALVVDASADERFSGSESMVSSGVRSLAAAPLIDGEGCSGMIALNSRLHQKRFSEEDLEELVSLAAAAALRIRNLALAEDAARRRVLEKELSLARRIQEALLPASLPAVPGFELHASNFPSRAVSGDLYQVQMRKDDSECVLLFADVAGKGMSAALLTASLEALAAGPIEAGLPADEICERISRRLHARTSAERYATGFVAVLEVARGVFTYCNAGHNPALLLRAGGGREELSATGVPLGLLQGSEFAREERVLGPGDLVVVYTDGITEAANPEGAEYGLDRLEAMCRAHMAEGVKSLGAALQKDLDAFAAGTPYGDDRTLVLLRRLP